MDDDLNTTPLIDAPCPVCGGITVTEQIRPNLRKPGIRVGEPRCTTPEKHPSGGV